MRRQSMQTKWIDPSRLKATSWSWCDGGRPWALARTSRRIPSRNRPRRPARAGSFPRKENWHPVVLGRVFRPFRVYSDACSRNEKQHRFDVAFHLGIKGAKLQERQTRVPPDNEFRYQPEHAAFCSPGRLLVGPSSCQCGAAGVKAGRGPQAEL